MEWCPLNLASLIAPVRRGDVVLMDPQPRRYHAIEEYMRHKNNVTKNVLLLTDDYNAVEEALYLFPEYKWVYLNRTRYRGAEGGWENHIPSDNPVQEVVALLSIFRLARKCMSMKSTICDSLVLLI
jgi:hypothetical protein